jgi:hypothetical protein
MSLPRLVRNSTDLSRLVNEGYAVRIHAGHLIVDDIPYATAAGTVARGSLVCPLDLQGDATARPSTHVMWFTEIPHTSDGREMTELVHERGPMQLAEGLIAAFSSSQKAHGNDYENFYDKVIAYARLVVAHAQALDPEAVPTTFRPVVTDESDSVFKYLDTNSSRAGVTALAEKVSLAKVGIIGVGGTGAYLLDLLAKVPIAELHLFDGDVFATHNAFRAPGAATMEEISAAPFKVNHHADRYEALRRGVVPHPVFVTADNITEVLGLDFVFLSMDANGDKKDIVEALLDNGIAFIDTGLGIRLDPGGLAGMVRVTTGLQERRELIDDDHLISYRLGDDDEYETNIQVAELNALAAVLAVIAFKKRYGFYSDIEREIHTLYRIDSNEIINAYGFSDTESASDLEEKSRDES